MHQSDPVLINNLKSNIYLINNFLLQGHDTISSGLAFALYLLSTDQKVQEKAFKEQRDIFQNENRAATYRDLTDMKYLEQVIKETLRLYPSVVVVGRSITEDVPISKCATYQKPTLNEFE